MVLEHDEAGAAMLDVDVTAPWPEVLLVCCNIEIKYVRPAMSMAYSILQDKVAVMLGERLWKIGHCEPVI